MTQEVTMRGPVPKRTSERRRTNKPPIPVETAPAAAPADPPALRRGIHPLARRWYRSLSESGQARWYEPSDWAMALVTAEMIDAFAKEPNAAALMAILKSSSSLLATEGDRRRMRIELSRAGVDDDEAAAVSALDAYRARLSS